MKHWRVAFLSALLLLLLCPLGATALDVRVLLGNNTSSAALGVYQGQYVIVDTMLNTTLGTVSKGESIVCNTDKGMLRLTVNGVELPNSSIGFLLQPADSECVMTFDSHHYRDGFSFTYFDDTKLNVLNVVEMEHYLYGVVGREIGSSSPAEALKVQAVCSRNYAAANISPNKRYDVSATTTSQAYGGFDDELKSGGAAVIKAVNDTHGEIMLYVGKVFPAYYSTNAGGYTEAIENVWGGSSAVPFVSIASPYDNNGSSSYSWQVNYSKDEFKKRIDNYAGKDIGEITDIIIDYNKNAVTNGFHRALKATVIGTAGSVSATKDGIRGLLGLKSTLFSLEFQKGDQSLNMQSNGARRAEESTAGVFAMTAGGSATQLGAKGVYVIGGGNEKRVLGNDAVADISIKGYGYGHGVGLSQAGAVGMAKAGFGYQEILSYYYFNNESFSFGNLYE